ncbi:uncharacterized protein LOC126419705 [Schistocerca serialis cubense]|uniref:uncharacterized protein LOC126419705 n=1 Tax=Schistocerca serialis cubense TaxID=2023355 RepID=UPI00214DFCAF|nr:uncharacterized protein LOC126419705 [Schistocerca serialis cubense]
MPLLSGPRSRGRTTVQHQLDVLSAQARTKAATAPKRAKSSPNAATAVDRMLPATGATTRSRHATVPRLLRKCSLALVLPLLPGDKPPNSDPHLVATAANPPTTHSHPQNRKSLPLGHPPPPPSAGANDEQPAPIAPSLVGEEGQPGPAPAPPAPAATIAGDLQALLQTLKVQSCHSFPR